MCVGNNSAYLRPRPTGPAQALFKTASRFVRQLEIFRVYTKRDYRDGLPDKAEWGQGLSPPSNRGLPGDRSASVWTVSPSMRCALTAVAGPAACALINPLYRTAQGVTGVIRPSSPPGCTASPAPGRRRQSGNFGLIVGRGDFHHVHPDDVQILQAAHQLDRAVGGQPTDNRGTGAGANAGSRQSISKVRYTGMSPTICFPGNHVINAAVVNLWPASSTVKPLSLSNSVRIPICTEWFGSISPSFGAV